MKYITVKFNGSKTNYVYKSKLNFIVGGKYNITADETTTYASPVEIISVTNTQPYSSYGIKIREITDAKILMAPPRPTLDAKFVINKEKGTTVALWKDGTKTIIKCQPGEVFDAEKGIAMCFVKRAFKNRGCYNDWLREVLKENGLVEEK